MISSEFPNRVFKKIFLIRLVFSPKLGNFPVIMIPSTIPPSPMLLSIIAGSDLYLIYFICLPFGPCGVKESVKALTQRPKLTNNYFFSILVCMHEKSRAQSNQLQLENALAAVFAEIQITACVIQYKVMDCAGAQVRNPGADGTYYFLLRLSQNLL